MLNRIICTIGTAALLSACDSGGGNSNPAPDPNIRTGSFIDSPVSGLTYKTDSQSGITDENGSFEFLEGELIEFSVGGIHLGSARASELVTPFSLLGAAPLTREATIVATLSDNNISSFDRVINIATFLQALDVDGDPENGIDLGDANDALKESSLNFSVKASKFEKQQDFLDLLSKLDISSHRSFTAAADHLYSSLGISVSSDLIASKLSNENNSIQNLISYSYNEEELVSAQETDIGNDGTIDKRVIFTYDDSNRLIETFDSSSNITETISYDTQGNILSKEISHPRDELSSYQVYTYTNSKLSTLETDLGNDGIVDVTVSYQYDTNGKLSKHSLQRTATQNTQTTTYTYADNRVKSLSEDRDGDNEPDGTINYNYDVKGNVSGYSSTRQLSNQTHIAISRFNYTADNQLSRYERDDDQDGEPDYIETYKYNDLGKRIEYKKDMTADGSWDFVAQYEYDSLGNKTRMIEDNNGDGIVDKIWQASYQAAVIEDAWELIRQQL